MLQKDAQKFPPSLIKFLYIIIKNQLKSLKVAKSIGKDDGGYDRSPIFHSIGPLVLFH